MKKILSFTRINQRLRNIFFLITMMFPYIASGQNLVPNPSFEDTVFCPNGYSEIYACKEWMNFGETPDYFNSCAPINGVNVPYSGFGFQYSHSGNAMIGVATYRQPNSPNGPNYREFVGANLIDTLEIGRKYYLSFFVNYSHYHPFQAVASNNIGIKLFTTTFDSIHSPQLNNSAIIYSQNVLTDSVNWIRISGSFVSDSAFTKIVIGNFFDDMHTDTTNLSNFPDGALYYIDDVCLTTDSLLNENWTGLLQVIKPTFDIQLFPNPSSGLITIMGHKEILKVEIYNSIGKLVLSEFKNSSEFTLNLGWMSPGIYYIKIFEGDKFIIKLISLTN